MTTSEIGKLRSIENFASLVEFLKDELNWQLDPEDIEELTYEYEPDELGLSEDIATKISEIKQLRPFSYDQPWGIFYIDFEPKRLPVTVLRRILQRLRLKKRDAAGSANMRHWDMKDILFITSYGPEDERSTTFAHFTKEIEDSAAVLRVITWDSKDTDLHIERCINELQNLRYTEELEPDQWREKWVKGFVLKHRHSIRTSKALAKRLAELSQGVREAAREILESEREEGPFRKSMMKFREALIHDLTIEDFAVRQSLTDFYIQPCVVTYQVSLIRFRLKESRSLFCLRILFLKKLWRSFSR